MNDSEDTKNIADPVEGEAVEAVSLPAQIGYRRYVYAAYFVFAIGLAYLLSKIGLSAWHKLSQSTPKVGEPREDLINGVAIGLSGFGAILGYKYQKLRMFSEEVAEELSKVEWPTREKVQRWTTIVVVASLVSAMGFWLYDILANRVVTALTESKHPIIYGLAAGLGLYGVRTLGARFSKEKVG